MSFDSTQPPGTRDSSYFPSQDQQVATDQDQPSYAEQSEPRPGNFLRRRTDLSTKELKRNEKQGLNLQQHLNLEGGLDIKLNCEVNQRDPAGITAPYRILVPSLWFEGEFQPLGEKAKRQWWKMGKRKNSSAPEIQQHTGEEEPGEEEEDAEEMEYNNHYENYPVDNPNEGEDETPPPMGQAYTQQRQQPYDMNESIQGSGSGELGQGYSGVEAYKPRKKWFGLV